MTTSAPLLVDEQPIIARDKDRFGAVGESPLSLLVYLLLGVVFGIILTKSEVVSWFRIQEMFRFQSFHMYGTIISAIAVAAVSLQIIRRRGIRTVGGVVINVPPKEKTPGLKRYWMGGIAFGLGWALLGACPGPIFALIGSGLTIMIVALAAAILGTWSYAWLKPMLPH